MLKPRMTLIVLYICGDNLPCLVPIGEVEGVRK